MTRRDDELDAMVWYLGAAYYGALHGNATAADVGRAVSQIDQITNGCKPLAGTESPAATYPGGRRRVSDVMTRNVIAVSGETGYKQTAQLLQEHHVTALPVVTPERHVVGIVSEADLLGKQEWHSRLEKSPDWQLRPQARVEAEAQTTADMMTAPAITTRPDAVLGEAARLMHSHHVKTLPVVEEDGKLIGIVSRADLLKAFLRPDAELASEASVVLADVLLANPEAVQVSARDGVMHLTGQLASQDQIATAVRLVSAIDGVVAVRCNLTAPSPGD